MDNAAINSNVKFTLTLTTYVLAITMAVTWQSYSQCLAANEKFHSQMTDCLPGQRATRVFIK